MARGGRQAVRVRGVQPGDLGAVVDIDAGITGLRKPEYWSEILQRYGIGRRQRRFFLVAEAAGRVEGFAIGEVRDWEFGAPPCGWVFAIDVDPHVRQRGVGTALLAAVRERFERVGVDRLRTMLARDNTLLLSFFRSQGMTAGHLIPLEIGIGAADAAGTTRRGGR